MAEQSSVWNWSTWRLWNNRKLGSMQHNTGWKHGLLRIIDSENTFPLGWKRERIFWDISMWQKWYQSLPAVAQAVQETCGPPWGDVLQSITYSRSSIQCLFSLGNWENSSAICTAGVSLPPPSGARDILLGSLPTFQAKIASVALLLYLSHTFLLP